jgi:1,4-dihydroxy-2-naphthoyl-CoA hydrolase
MTMAAEIQKRIQPLFPGLMGVEIKEAMPDRIVATMLVRPDLCTAGGVCHGGAYMAFADTVGAVGTVVNLPPGARTTTIESKTNFMGAAPVDTLITAESIPLHRGKSTQVWQTTIRSEAGKLCAIVTQTQMVLPASSA